MTNTQNLGAIIVELMEHEPSTKAKLAKAEKYQEWTYMRVQVWEEAYADSDEDETVGERLDEAYNEHEEAYTETDRLRDKAEAIDEALQALRKAAELIEWLGL